MLILADPPISGAQARAHVYLPIIVTPNPVASFYRLLVGDERQQRSSLEVCPCLERAAQRRALGLVGGDPWAHVDGAGVTPNEYARAAGCHLPADYALRGNNVESLVAGTADPLVVFAALASSPAHAAHLFGQGWFAHQRHMGIALGEGGRLGWYWVVLIATCEQSSGE